MTRVLLISRCPPYPLHLGDRLILYHLARELESRDVTLDLIAFAERPADWSLSEQQHYNSYFYDMMLFDTRQRPLSELGRRALFPAARFPRQAAHAFAPEMWRHIERQINSQDYDVVHLFGGVQVYEFKHALGGLPTIITPYESYSLYTRRELAQGGTLRQRLMRGLRHRLARSFERWMFAPYDVTTVVSEVDRDELLALNPALRVEVIPNGIDLAQFRVKNTPRDPHRILFVGNYEYPPNLNAAHWLATEILPKVRQQIPEARLWLVGNAPPPALQALASEHIEVTGRVPSVQPYYAEASVFVCPLRLGAGIKNKVLEALASGCPVVASPLSVDGIRVVNDESVLLGEDADVLAAQTVRLLRDPSLAASLRGAGRALIEAHYSWGGVADRYAALYRELAGAGKNAGRLGQ